MQNKQTKMTDYGNGIYASNPMLAKIAMAQLEQEKRQREARAAARAEGIQSAIWHISDRD